MVELQLEHNLLVFADYILLKSIVFSRLNTSGSVIGGLLLFLVSVHATSLLCCGKLHSRYTLMLNSCIWQRLRFSKPSVNAIRASRLLQQH